MGVIGLSVLSALVIVSSKPDVITQEPKVAPRLVKVVEVHTESIQMDVKSQGTVVPRTESELVSQISGLVEWVAPAFAAGGFFEAGQVLIKIDRRDYELALIQAESQVAKSRLAVDIEEEQARIAREEWQRLNQDQSAPPLVARQPQLSEAKAALASAEAAHKQARLNLERTTIRAPFAGRVRVKNVDVGQYVSTGMSLARIYSIDYAEIRLPLPDQDLAYLDMPFDFRGNQSATHGPDVTLRAEFAGGHHQWHGYVSRLEAEIDARSRMVHAVVRVPDPYGKSETGDRPPLAVGLFVDAEIAGKTFEHVITVPRAALRPDSTVLVADMEDRIRVRKVGILRLDSESAFVDSGLSDGDRVCVSTVSAVVDGMRVTPLVE